jgi:hypothetical protein
MLDMEGFEGCRTNAHLRRWQHVKSGKIHTSRRSTIYSYEHIKPILQNVKTYIGFKLILRKRQVYFCLGLKHDLGPLTCVYR